jgi:hypothetical protein
MFEILCRRIVNARRWIGGAWYGERGEEEAGRYERGLLPQVLPQPNLGSIVIAKD